MATQRRTLTERRSSLVEHEAGVVALNAESVFDANVVIRRLRQEALAGRPCYTSPSAPSIS
jgi:hypothetical protein